MIVIMKKTWLAAMAALVALSSCASVQDEGFMGKTGEVVFIDNAVGSAGSEIYHSIIPDPEKYIRERAVEVMETLYFTPEDSIVNVDTLFYRLEDVDGISAKDGGNGKVTVFYSTRYIASCFAGGDTSKVLAESRGVLLHELTHAYQLEPQGIGDYGSSRVFWSFIEGMADAVRIVNGGFGDASPVPGGSYMDGYRTAGYFFAWLKENKDADFLKKFNQTTLTVVPWSYDGAFRSIFGEETSADSLWEEYQNSLAAGQEDNNKIS